MQIYFILRRLATLLAVITLTLSLIAAVTGTLLAFNYQPTAGGAYDSIKQIVTEVPNGWLVKKIHDLAGNGLITVSLIQIVVMFLGRQFRSSWLTAWISGIALALAGIALGWTAMILDWTQLGYWRLSIEFGTITAIPLVGPLLRDILSGGGAIATATVERLYALHSYILPIGAIVLAVIHLGSLLVQEQHQVQALSGKTAEESQVSAQNDKESRQQLPV